MKRAFATKFLTIISGFTLVFAATNISAYQYTMTPVVDYSGWSATNDNVSINAGVVTLHASGGEGNYGHWIQMFTDSYADALYAKINVVSAHCPVLCKVALKRHIGTIDGYTARVEINLASFNDVWSVRYQVTGKIERPEGPIYKRYIEGFIGNRYTNEMDLNTAIGIAVGIKGHEMIFYGENRSMIAKVELFAGFKPYSTPEPWRVIAETASDEDSITAIVTGFTNIKITP